MKTGLVKFLSKVGLLVLVGALLLGISFEVAAQPQKRPGMQGLKDRGGRPGLEQNPEALEKMGFLKDLSEEQRQELSELKMRGDALMLMGEIAEEREDFQTAIGYYEQVVAISVPGYLPEEMKKILDRGRSGLKMKMMMLYHRLGETDKAEQLLNSLLDDPNLPPQARNQLLMQAARQYRKAGDLERAEGILKQLLNK